MTTQVFKFSLILRAFIIGLIIYVCFSRYDVNFIFKKSTHISDLKSLIPHQSTCQKALLAALKKNNVKNPLLGMITYISNSWTEEIKQAWVNTKNIPFFNHTDDIISRLKKTPCHNSGKKRIAMAAITNGLSPINIQEWIIYHLILGVSKFIIFDHCETNSLIQKRFHKALKPFLDLEIVQLEFVKKKHSDWIVLQSIIYNDALKLANTFDWVGFLDTDELLILHSDTCLTQLLDNYNAFGSVAFKWKELFTMHDNSINQPKTIMETSKYGRNEDSHPLHFKSFLQPKHVNRMNVHHADLLKGFNNTIISRKISETYHYSLAEFNYVLHERVCGTGFGRTNYYPEVRAKQFIDMMEITVGRFKETLELLQPKANSYLLEFLYS